MPFPALQRQGDEAPRAWAAPHGSLALENSPFMNREVISLQLPSPSFVMDRTRKKWVVPAATPAGSVFAWRVTGTWVHVFGSVLTCHAYAARTTCRAASMPSTHAALRAFLIQSEAR